MNRPIQSKIQKENGTSYFSPNAPTWIRVPKEMGGQKKKVLRKYDMEFCRCLTHPTTIYELEDDIIVCRCDINGYIFGSSKK
jgi:hypothetical protein